MIYIIAFIAFIFGLGIGMLLAHLFYNRTL